jgi:uroporphyrinogen-III synthase
MTATVALFRAREDAAASAKRLRRLGFAVAWLPVIEIQTRAVQPRQEGFDAAIATSDKAFLAGAPGDASTPIFVVGARSARAAKARGWRLGSPPAADATELIDVLTRRLRPGARLLYLAGRDRKSPLEEALARVFTLETVETYAAEARAEWRPAEARLLATCTAALHYSRRSAELAEQLARRSGETAHFLALRHVCLSGDVAEPLTAAGASSIAVAETPDEAALLEALAQDLRGFPSLKASRI